MQGLHFPPGLYSGLEDDGEFRSNLGPRLCSLENKEEVFRMLGRAMILPLHSGSEGKYRTPVVTLHNTEASNLYSLLERTLRPEFCVGGERFWKIIRADQNLDTWRPRVHGTQLKALTNCRLPELPEEYAAVEREISSIHAVLRPEVSPQMFVAELKNFVAGVEVWWEGRNARRPPNVDQGAGSTKRSSAAAANNFYAPPAKQQQQSQGMTRRSAGLPPDNGMVSSAPPPPVEVPMPPASQQPDLGMLMQGAAAPFLQALPLPSTPDPPGLISLNVGGKSYATTTHTLLAVPNSFFWEILTPGPQGEQPNPLRNQNGEIFIDRNGKLFTYVLEHLRSLSHSEPTSPLPEDANELAALAREAEYYGLPSLLNRIRNTAIMPQPNTQAMYDSIYLETGFNSIEGPGLKEMEQRKVLVMQQMNHVLAQKALDGFFVAACDCGVNHRDVEDGGMHHNLFYHILLKRVMPVAPSLHPPEIHMQQQQQQPQPPVPLPAAEAMLQHQIQAAAMAGLDLSGSGGGSAALPTQVPLMQPLHTGGGGEVVGPPLPLQLQGAGLQGPVLHPSLQAFQGAGPDPLAGIPSTNGSLQLPPLQQQQQQQHHQHQGMGEAIHNQRSGDGEGRESGGLTLPVVKPPSPNDAGMGNLRGGHGIMD